ncbi:uncharacterized protein BDV17DRAFT_219027 [Aspergillus undulatus]|uniref:uncharacterized protein n=1 Tax=Aspergillus undulatus TaxID=1810928 RepID=UPI003CCDB94E
MSATLAQMQPVPNPSHYPWTPARPSPLSPRRQSSTTRATFSTPNQPQFQSPTSIFAFTPSPSPSPPKFEFLSAHKSTTSPFPQSPNLNATTSPTPSTSNQNQTYATRYRNQISNPLTSHSQERTFASSTSPRARSVRRKAFLNRVKQDRDSGRFEARSEHLAYIEGVAEQKEYVEEMRRRAEEIQGIFGVVEDEDGWEGFQDAADEAEIQALDEYIEQERAAEMGLVERMESQNANANAGHVLSYNASGATSSFSDDEYDDLFMDLADHHASQSAGDMDMEMSG